MSFPIAVTDDHHSVRVLRVVTFRSGEETPGLGLHPKQFEKVSRYQFAPNLRSLRSIAHRKNIANARGDRSHQPQIVPVITEIEVRRGKRLAVGSGVL